MSKTARHNKMQKFDSVCKSKVECKHCVHLNKRLSLGSQLPTNHWLRDNRDPCKRFICPVMLKTRCGSCNKMGHADFWCTKKGLDPLDSDAYFGFRGFLPPKPAVIAKVSVVPTSNAFSGLDLEDGEVEEDTAAEVSSSLEEDADEKRPRVPSFDLLDNDFVQETTFVNKNLYKPHMYKQKCWADMVDSDDEDSE